MSIKKCVFFSTKIYETMQDLLDFFHIYIYERDPKGDVAPMYATFNNFSAHIFREKICQKSVKIENLATGLQNFRFFLIFSRFSQKHTDAFLCFFKFVSGNK